MKTLEVLKKARFLIAHGWVQGTLKREKCYCALGAISYAIDDLPMDESFGLFTKARRRVAEAVCGDQYAGIVEWNDSPGRTKAEVLQAFDDAIKLEEASENHN